MLKTLNLSGFATGDSLSVSVSQNSVMAGPVNVAAWGQANTGGVIAINADRTTLQCAPDSVRFTVDLSGSTFDTAGPSGAEIYDARMHDLIYLWDFDDASSGDWTAPGNVLPGWKNRNVAKGPFVSHVYTQPGTYNPSVLIIEPSSGKIANATVPVVVVNADSAYPTTQTICVSTSGDFAGAPTGAVSVTASQILDGAGAWDTYASASNPIRWLFRAGETFDLSVELNAAHGGGMMFGKYGTGARPIVNAVEGGAPDTRNIVVEGVHGGSDVDTTTYDLRLEGLDFRGSFDPTTTVEVKGLENTVARNVIRVQRHLDFVMSNCHARGYCRSFFSGYPSQKDQKMHYHFDDCHMTEFGGQYPIILTPVTHPKTSFSITGTAIVQNPMAHGANANGLNKYLGSRSPVRINHAAFTHVRGCDIFHTDGYGQPCIKFVETPQGDGTVINAHSCSLEGGGPLIGFGGNLGSTSGSVQRSTVHNAIIDGFVMVGTHSTDRMMNTRATGITLRNCLMIMPGVQKKSGRLSAFIEPISFGTFDATIVGAAPLNIYNNTFRSDRTNTQNGSPTDGTIRDSSGGLFTAINVDNNVLHMPNYDTPQIAFAPLSNTPLFTARNIGYVDPEDFSFDSSYATLNPTMAIGDTRPLPGSAALGAALSGEVSYMDILLKDRPEPPSQGAWEAD